MVASFKNFLTETRGFRAIADNGNGKTFLYTFQHPNWNGIEKHAQTILDNIVAKDPLHQKHGPWKATRIDVHPTSDTVKKK